MLSSPTFEWLDHRSLVFNEACSASTHVATRQLAEARRCFLCHVLLSNRDIALGRPGITAARRPLNQDFAQVPSNAFSGRCRCEFWTRRLAGERAGVKNLIRGQFLKERLWHCGYCYRFTHSIEDFNRIAYLAAILRMDIDDRC